MGKGKGSPEAWVAPVSPGRIIIEAEGVPFETAKEAPLAKELFAKFDYIKRVFYMSPFITVTKDSATEWFEVKNEIQEFIKDAAPPIPFSAKLRSGLLRGWRIIPHGIRRRLRGRPAKPGGV